MNTLYSRSEARKIEEFVIALSKNEDYAGKFANDTMDMTKNRINWLDNIPGDMIIRKIVESGWDGAYRLLFVLGTILETPDAAYYNGSDAAMVRDRWKVAWDAYLNICRVEVGGGRTHDALVEHNQKYVDVLFGIALGSGIWSAKWHRPTKAPSAIHVREKLNRMVNARDKSDGAIKPQSTSSYAFSAARVYTVDQAMEFVRFIHAMSSGQDYGYPRDKFAFQAFYPSDALLSAEDIVRDMLRYGGDDSLYRLAYTLSKVVYTPISSYTSFSGRTMLLDRKIAAWYTSQEIEFVRQANDVRDMMIKHLPRYSGILLEIGLLYGGVVAARWASPPEGTTGEFIRKATGRPRHDPDNLDAARKMDQMEDAEKGNKPDEFVVVLALRVTTTTPRVTTTTPRRSVIHVYYSTLYASQTALDLLSPYGDISLGGNGITKSVGGRGDFIFEVNATFDLVEVALYVASKMPEPTKIVIDDKNGQGSDLKRLSRDDIWKAMNE